MWICGGQSGTGTSFSLSTSVPPISIIPPILSSHFYLLVALTRRTGEAREPFRKQFFVGNWGEFGREVTLPFLVFNGLIFIHINLTLISKLGFRNGHLPTAYCIRAARRRLI